MIRIQRALEMIEAVNEHYSLNNKDINVLFFEIRDAKVCMPIIGKFSAGKSALLNSLLNYGGKLLKEDVTPETAVPTELVFSEEDKVEVLTKDNDYYTIDSLKEYRKKDFEVESVKSVRLYLNNQYLKTIPKVMLVDMPGFESGYDVHNQAIDEYLPKSLVYLIAFPADDMIMRSSIGNILKEICLRNMKIGIVITKCDKKNEGYDAALLHLKQSLKKYIGEREIKICQTSSRDKEMEELKAFLCEIQENAEEILYQKYKQKVLLQSETTKNYLTAILKNSEMTESELEEEKLKLEQSMGELIDKFQKEKAKFENKIENSASNIKADIHAALEGKREELVSMIMNNQDIKEGLNLTIRNAVTSSMQERFLPNVEHYLSNVTSDVMRNISLPVNVPLAINPKAVSENVISSAVATTAAVMLGGPIIGGVIAGILFFMNQKSQEKKREEQERKISTKLARDVFPKVLSEVEDTLVSSIEEQIAQVNKTIEEDITRQRSVLEKAIEDVKERIVKEKEKKNSLIQSVKEDLEKLEKMEKELLEE